MSQPALKRHPFDDAAELELAAWPGVTAERRVRSKHFALILTFNGQGRMVIYAATPGDTRRGAQNHIGVIRKELRELGAERCPEPRTAPRNKARPPRGHQAEPRAFRPVSVQSNVENGPLRDPWAALAQVKFPAPSVQGPEPIAAVATRPWWARWLENARGMVEYSFRRKPDADADPGGDWRNHPECP